jgi:excinuclease ABC subunit B
VQSPFQPMGDQPEAISLLVNHFQAHEKKEDVSKNKYGTLRGITGSGKSFVMSHVISRLDRPALILCPTKTLAAQLTRELRSFLPHNAVELFVSYYNYYTPESFIESTNTCAQTCYSPTFRRVGIFSPP